MASEEDDGEMETEDFSSSADLSLADIIGVLNKPEKQAAMTLGVSLHSLRKNSRIHNIRRWPFRKIQISTKKGVKLSEEDILAYCQAEVATDVEGVDLGLSVDAAGPSSPASDPAVTPNVLSRGGSWRDVSEGEGLELGKSKEEEDEADVGKVIQGSLPPGQFPNIFIGRRIRYKFVCTPPQGYVPSELDAKTLPKGFFERCKDVFSLKGGVLERGLGGALRPPLARNDSMGCEAGAEGKDPTGGAVLAVMRDGSGGREDDGRGAVESRQAVVAAGRRKGKMGLHVSDALVFSRGVAQQLEAQAEVLSLPFNLQPPKKRFRSNYGYVTDPPALFHIRGLPQRSPSPPPTLAAWAP